MLARKLEQLWQDSIEAPDVFDFLRKHDGAPRSALLAVIRVDQCLRWKTDAPLQVEDYLAELPQLVDDPDSKLELVVGEFEARLGSDDSPTVDEYASRFGELAETLRSRLSEVISAAGDAERDDVEQTSHNHAGEPGGADHPSETTLTLAVRRDSTGDARMGRYRIVRTLGEGGYGRVFLAIDEELQRQVAIKVPTSERIRSKKHAEMYLDEARHVARLDHPNIVPVYDMGHIDDGSIYVVSKFIEGRTLEELIKEDRPDFAESARLIAAVARALHHAHEKRLIHRDVKPANILLEEAARIPYVADFGLAIREDDHLQAGGGGTAAYMSPEQARGVGHRLDGRSDVFSVGIVLYELIVGQRPFRGSTPNEVLHQISSVDPIPPRKHDDSIPAELERICLKALAKRASDRYDSAAAMAEDLEYFLEGPKQEEYQETLVVPRGLRSFGPKDADFFLDLLPGPHTREGLPESIDFWKRGIEESDPAETFTVGLLYGPSGCGKSSLVKAGLLPRVSEEITAIYVEATPDDTESRILRNLRKAHPTLQPSTESTSSTTRPASLSSTFAALRRSGNGKTVVIIDQFEQWLHAHPADTAQELVQALWQCDGKTLQAILMVRDDFAMPAARFMDALDVPIVQGRNFRTVDLFDLKHARGVLTKFGRAYGKLPAGRDGMSDDNQSFLAAAVEGLAQDGKVISVQLALFAEMVKDKPWTPGTLESVGGTEGVGVSFLEETFASRSANPKYRQHQQAARNVLAVLLPEVGTDIKGHMRSREELLAASGYIDNPTVFDELMRILDGELRLITPTDEESDSHSVTAKSGDHSSHSTSFYQLTHDFLVPSLRRWLTQKQQETRAGRAALRLAERTALWNAKPENRHLPSLAEWLNIRLLTQRKRWKEPERKMMRRANWYYTGRAAAACALLLITLVAGLRIRANLVAKSHEQRAAGIVATLAKANTGQVPGILEELADYRQFAQDDLTKLFDSPPEDLPNAKLHAALALLDDDDSKLDYFKEQLLSVSPGQFATVRDLLASRQSKLVDGYWMIAVNEEEEPARRFQAACAMAAFDPSSEHWQDEELCRFVADHLVRVRPSELAPWRDALRPVKERLAGALGEIFRDEDSGESVLAFATETLVDYLQDDAKQLALLITDAEKTSFRVIYPALERHGEEAVKHLHAVLDRKLEPNWNDDPLDPNWKPPAIELRAKIETAHGKIAEQFAFCVDLPWEELDGVLQGMTECGYRPVRIRSWDADAVSSFSSLAPHPSPLTANPCVSVVFKRDGKPWKLEKGLSKEQMPDPNKPAVKDGLVPIDITPLAPNPQPPTPTFLLLWGPPEHSGEQRRVIVDLSADEITGKEHVKPGFCLSPFDDYPAQTAIAVWADKEGQRRYGGIWSTHGVRSQVKPAYAGFELVDEPHWDMAVGPEGTLPDPIARYRVRLAEIKQLPNELAASVRVRAIQSEAKFWTGDYSGALEDFDFVLKQDSSADERIHYRRVWTLARLGKTKAAQDALAKHKQKYSSSQLLPYVESVALAWLGEHAAAAKRLTEYEKASSDDAGELYHVASAAALCALPLREDDSQRAGTYVQTALRLLGRAINQGWAAGDRTASDAHLLALHGEREFRSLLQRIRLTAPYATIQRADTTVESKLVRLPLDERFSGAVSELLDSHWRIAGITVPPATHHPSPPTPNPQPLLILHRRLIPDSAKESLALQQSAAAVALLKMGAADRVWEVFEHRPDPRVRSYLIHRLASHDVGPAILLERLLDETEVSRRRAMILSIGEYAQAELLAPEQHTAATQQLALWYANDPDPGIHGACEWALRKLGAGEQIENVRQVLAMGEVVGNRRWFITKTGRMTFAIVDLPDVFLIGSPVYEAERHGGATNKDEIRYRRRIDRQYAVAMHEVTVEQFMEFRKDHRFERTKAREPDAPANMVTWYDAAAFCNWLSDQEGISQEDWCYDPDEGFREGMVLPGDYLRRTGYRLLTEAEWEYACRAGAVTARHYGETPRLLGQYAWYTKNSLDRWMLPVGSLKPNDLGLFDMQGNALEWCQDRAYLYEKESGIVDDKEQTGAVKDSDFRVLRGGSLAYNASTVRSAYHNFNRPYYWSLGYGFRVSRTYP